MLLEGDCAVRVRVEAWVVDGCDEGRRLEGMSDHGGVVGGFAGTEVEGLETAVGEPAVEGGGDGADGVLEEGETGIELFGVECGDTHENVLNYTVSHRCS